MATHKVPQDVETEDKLIGFLSMRQFIFVVVGLGFGWLTFFFATKINVFLSIIWVPFTVVPLVLGLYQRPDQPVEIFLASAIRYYFKPRKRKWDQEGFVQRVVVTAPPKVEHRYTKEFSGDEAASRLERLSRLMDSRGWVSKLDTDWQNPQLAATAASESRIQTRAGSQQANLDSYTQPTDIMDEQSSLVSREFQSRIDTTDTSARAQALKSFNQARAAVTPAEPTTPAPAAQAHSSDSPQLTTLATEAQDSSKPNPASTAPHAHRTSDNKGFEVSLR